MFGTAFRPICGGGRNGMSHSQTAFFTGNSTSKSSTNMGSSSFFNTNSGSKQPPISQSQSYMSLLIEADKLEKMNSLAQFQNEIAKKNQILQALYLKQQQEQQQIQQLQHHQQLYQQLQQQYQQQFKSMPKPNTIDGFTSLSLLDAVVAAAAAQNSTSNGISPPPGIAQSSGNGGNNNAFAAFNSNSSFMFPSNLNQFK